MGQEQSKKGAYYQSPPNTYHSGHLHTTSHPMTQNTSAPSSPPPYSPIDPSPMGRNRTQSARVGSTQYNQPLPQVPQGDVPQISNPSPRRASTQHNSRRPTQHPPTSAPAAHMSWAPPARQTGIIDSGPSRHSRQGTMQENAAQPAPRRAGTTSQQEDPLLQLKKYDTVIVVDDSSSMAGALWFEAKEALTQLAELAVRYDEDGIDVHFLNSTKRGIGIGAADVRRLFDQVDPDGITPTGEKLEELLLDYMLKLEASSKGQPDAAGEIQQVKPVNFLIITDGEPSDDPETVIVAAARRLDKGRFPISQVGIQFVQIGSDPRATEALQELDDDLAARYQCRDIVDTTLYTGQSLDANILTKALLGGINRRVDRRGAA